jgi:hypothetical protein
MPDLFVAFAYQDRDFAAVLTDSLAGRGLEVGRELPLWPGQRLLPLIDQGLQEARHAVVIVSRVFLKLSWEQKVLDGLASRLRVVSLLHEIDEAEVGPHSARLAVSVIPGGFADELARLLAPDSGGDLNGWATH